MLKKYDKSSELYAWYQKNVSCVRKIIKFKPSTVIIATSHIAYVPDALKQTPKNWE